MTAKRFAITRLKEFISDGLYFNRYFFKQRMGAKLIVSEHHRAIQSALDKCISGDITRLIINVPPGYTKTELASIGMMARGLCINPRSRFLHLSYSHKLALLNSATARSMVQSKEFQNVSPIVTRSDADSKEIWLTEDGGGVIATSASGQVTGFRAGHMEDGFTGCLIIDDPVKPDDAYSEVMREGVNNRYNETISSRVAIESIPIIVIMQRIHHNDLTGYLLRGGSGEKWHHLNLPVIIDNSKPYPSEYTHGIPVDHGLRDGWLWPFKHNDKHDKALRSHRRKFAAQYMQDPIKRDEETALWKESTINNSRALDYGDRPIKTVVSIDPATTNNTTSDEHGITVESKHGDNQYSVDADYSIKGSPKQWAERAIMAYEKHSADAIVIETNQGGDMCEETLRNAGFDGKIIRVHASKGKVARAEPVAALYEMGYVSHGVGLVEVEDEMMDMDPLTGKSNGRSPNRVDSVVWGLSYLSGCGEFTDYASIL